MPRFLYVECDGQLFLVRREGRLALPTEDEVPFAVVRRVGLNFPDADVTFCTPEDGRWRAEWLPKDKVPGLPDVDPLVHRAVNATLVREVTGAFVVDGRDVLLVKANRGFTKGMWNIPGGFVLYGETPEEGVVREVEEEIGLRVTVERALGVRSMRFASPYFMRAHLFLCRTPTRETKPDPDEIQEARWFRLEEAASLSGNPFAKEGVRILREAGL